MRVHNPKFSRLLLLILLLNILAAQLLHEAGHWAVLQAFGRRPLWGFTSMVQLWDKMPSSSDNWVKITSIDGSLGWLHLESAITSDTEWLLFLAAGPLIQLVAVAAGFMLARFGKSSPVSRTIGFLVALVNSFSGFLYQVVNLLRGVGGDEALIAHYLGLSPVAVSAVLGVAFGLGLVIGFRAVGDWRSRLRWGAALLLGVLPVGPLLMRANTVVIEQVDAGNPLFRSLIGFSFPVFLTGLVCLLLISFMAYRWEVTAADS
jgi:hypothetical protein